MPQGRRNVDPAELARFGELAAHWWDAQGELRTLHDINPLRLEYIDARCGLQGRRVLDVGCGGGILSESMALRGALVSGIDASGEALQVARMRQHEQGTRIEYRETTVEELAAAEPGAWEALTCMELLEHVPDPAALVRACASLVRPGGDLFFSTINRTPRAYLLAVLGAEYVLGLVPRGTHDYARLIRPSELAAWGRAAGLELRELAGAAYNPLTRRARLRAEVSVNYMAWMRRPDAPPG